MKDFFISYNSADRQWAEWIAWQLEDAGYSTAIQAWDFRPGSNFVLEMQKAATEAQRTIAVLSPDYLKSLFTQPEWAAAFAQDPTGEKRTLVNLRVRECELKGLLSQIVYVDLVGLDETAARETLLAGVQTERAKPKTAPVFPSPKTATSARPRFPGALPPIWNVPHHRNPNFTGREELLQNLRAALASEQSAALTQAIHGLGGVGKTQLAVEYAYRFSHEYEAVWWLAAESPATLAADYAALAQPLALPEKEAADQNLAIAAVRHWLNHHDRWLLVFDNALEVEALHGYLPQATTGHVLITSRNPNWRRLAQPLAVSTFAPEEAIDFLCKRTGQTDRDAALKLAEALGHLPLALTQAAAYIEETGKPLADYLALYQQHRQKLLDRAKPAADYLYTVATTWEISFQAVQLQCAAATDLLHLCAFFAPEIIPWDLLQPVFSQVEQLKTSALADPFKSDDAVAALRRYSLLEVKDQSLSLHRLVQQVIQDRLPEAERKHWQEAAVRLVAEAFPSGVNPIDVRTWPVCRRLLAHALLLSEVEIALGWVAFLSNQVGLYFNARANYAEAEPLFRRSVKILEQQLGPEHPAVATSLNNLALLLKSQGKYAEAEPLYRRSLEIREQQLGSEHPDVATSLNNLAALLESQGKSAEAEPLFRRSLKIREQQLGPEHPDVAQSLNNLAALLKSQGKSAEAELLFRRSLKIWEQQFGPEHPNVASSLNNLAELLRSQGKYVEAELLFRRSFEIREQQLGPEHPDVAASLNSLAALLEMQSKPAEAELLYRRSLEIREQQLGPEHPDVATSLNNLAGLLKSQGKSAEAELLFRRSLKIREQQLGPKHPHVANSLNNLAELLRAQGKYVEAEPLYRRSLEIQERQFGSEHPDVATILNNLALLLESQGKPVEAEPLFCRSLKIREQQLGPKHPNVANSLNNLAELLRAQGKYVEAEPLYRRSLEIREQQLGPEHPDVAQSLNNLAELLWSQGKSAEAEPLFRRSLAIFENALGPEHPTTQTVRENLALLLEAMRGK